jgi:hypothetical protein
MFASLTPAPCPDCGASLAHDPAAHECDDQRRLDLEMLRLRTEIAGLVPQLQAWLATPQGRFAVWIAERERPAF